MKPDRCLQTADPVARALRLPIYVEHGKCCIPVYLCLCRSSSVAGLSEYHLQVKEGTGLIPRCGSATSLQPFFSRIDPTWSSIWYPSRKGETLEDIHARANGFLQEFYQKVRKRLPPEERRRVLFVTHGAVTIALTRELFGDRSLPMRVGCCSLTELKRQREDTGNSILGCYEPTKLAWDGHIAGDALRSWGFEDTKMIDGKVRMNF